MCLWPRRAPRGLKIQRFVFFVCFIIRGGPPAVVPPVLYFSRSFCLALFNERRSRRLWRTHSSLNESSSVFWFNGNFTGHKLGTADSHWTPRLWWSGPRLESSCNWITQQKTQQTWEGLWNCWGVVERLFSSHFNWAIEWTGQRWWKIRPGESIFSFVCANYVWWINEFTRLLIMTIRSRKEIDSLVNSNYEVANYESIHFLKKKKKRLELFYNCCAQNHVMRLEVCFRANGQKVPTCNAPWTHLESSDPFVVILGWRKCTDTTVWVWSFSVLYLCCYGRLKSKLRIETSQGKLSSFK